MTSGPTLYALLVTFMSGSSTKLHSMLGSARGLTVPPRRRVIDGLQAAASGQLSASVTGSGQRWLQQAQGPATVATGQAQQKWDSQVSIASQAGERDIQVEGLLAG